MLSRGDFENDAEYRAFIKANQALYFSSQGRELVSQKVDRMRLDKKAQHAIIELDYQNQIAKLQTQVQTLQKSYEGEIREATFSEIQELIKTIMRESDADIFFPEDDIVDTDLIDVEGNMTRRPTANELLQIREIYNGLGGKHITPLPLLGYKVDESDPQMVEIDRQRAEDLAKAQQDTEQHIIDMRTQDAQIRQQITTEYNKLLAEAVGKKEEAQAQLQKEMSLMKALERKHEEMKRLGGIEAQLRLKSKEEQKAYLLAVEADKANLKAQVADLNADIVKLDTEKASLTAELSNERIKAYQDLKDKDADIEDTLRQIHEKDKAIERGQAELFQQKQETKTAKAQFEELARRGEEGEELTQKIIAENMRIKQKATQYKQRGKGLVKQLQIRDKLLSEAKVRQMEQTGMMKEDIHHQIHPRQSENVSLEIKEGTGDIIDNTGSSGIGAGADANTQQTTSLRGRAVGRLNNQMGGAVPPPPPPQQIPPPQQQQPLPPQPIVAPPNAIGQNLARIRIAGTVGNYMARVRASRIRQGYGIIEALNDQHYRDNRRDNLVRQHQEWLNGDGIPLGLQIPTYNAVYGNLENSTYAQNQQQSQSAYEADQKSKMEADYDTKTDALTDVSKFGYDSQVSKYAKQQGRDFTYTMSMVAKSKNAPSKDPTQRARQKDLLLKEWGHTIGIKKAKGNSYEECLEIYTIVFLAEDLYRMERNWKKSIIKFLPYLENLSHQANIGSQLGMITASRNPMTMTQANALISATQLQGARTRQTIMRGTPPPTPPSLTPQTSVGSAPPLAQPVSAQSHPLFDATARQRAQQLRQMAGGGESKGGNRRRLTGFGREVSYTQTADNTIVGQNYSATGIASARLPHMPSGIQSVRQIKAQLPRPPTKTSKRDGRPKMNVEKTKFKMRNSRINPNLLFVNLDKQNPDLTQEMPIFKPRLTNKELNRIKF